MKRSSGLVASILCAAILAVLPTFRPVTLYAQTPAPVLNVAPREIDLGGVTAGQTLKGKFTLSFPGPAPVAWSTQPLAGWTFLDQDRLSGTIGAEPGILEVRLSRFDEGNERDAEARGATVTAVRLTLESGGKSITARRDFSAGPHRMAIPVSLPGGVRNLYIRFSLPYPELDTFLSVDPPRLDFGSLGPGETSTRRIRLTNAGRERVDWKAIGAVPEEEVVPIRKGRYLSFQNPELHGAGPYQAPLRIAEAAEFSAGWSEEGGYPVSHPQGSSLKCRFKGTGLVLHLWKSPDGGSLSIYVDNRLVETVDGMSNPSERLTTNGIAGLNEGPHELTVVVKGGRLKLEGMTVYGHDVRRGPADWISLFPDSGVITRETDFVNVALHAQNVAPGTYRDHLLIRSTGGDQVIDLSVEVRGDSPAKIIDVYRYFRDKDCLFTVNPQAEAPRLHSGGYQRQGVAFRLFSPGTPGTTELYRWFNPRKRDHYYTVNRSGVNAQSGYVLEGVIGQIATSRLNDTRPLYRWRHPRTGHHFFTTDQSGEGRDRKGFRFEGIVGYVR